MSDGKHSPQSHDTSSNFANKWQRKVVSKAFWSLGAARGLRRIFKENLGACERFTPFDRHEKSDGVRSTSGYCALDGDPGDARNLIPIQKNSGVDRAEINSPAELQKLSASGNINGIIEGKLLATRRWGFSSCGFRGLTSVGCP